MMNSNPGRTEDQSKEQSYGIELLLDLKGCDPEQMGRERIMEYFVSLCQKIDMKRHGEPLFWEDWSGTPHLHGTSAIQFIETSNIVCHALPLLKSVFLNIFSCKKFNVQEAMEFSNTFWRATSVHHTVVNRT